VACALYIHGFASSPQSAKLVALQGVLGSSIELNAPDMNVPSFERLDFEAMMALAVGEAERKRPQVIVGSSLGGIVALELVRRGVRAPLVLIAPGVGIGNRWTARLPAGDPVEVFNHARNAQAKIHREFFESMKRVRPEMDVPPVRVTILIGRNDETVPFAFVRGVWEDWTASGRLVTGSKFIEIAGGDHGLVGYVDVIADAVRQSVSS
jgi:uncharacterized protein